MRIWGSQRSHFPLRRTVFCFRFFVSFVSPSAIANLVLFGRPGCTPSSANRGLDSVRISMGEPREHENLMSMGESHGHGRTPCAYGGVNGVTFRFIVHSSASGTSSALSPSASDP